jgi:predicted Rossmann fold nucleotide-binding protein DprA/Smf involved in DNA uptake
MTWVAVSGSWRHAPPGLSDAVRQEVAAALRAGKSIVTGGALGVDYWAAETALNIDEQCLKPVDRPGRAGCERGCTFPVIES